MGARVFIIETQLSYVVECRSLCDDIDMPLSDDEQRILSQIEQQLHETDPALAKEVATTTVYTIPLEISNGLYSVLLLDS